MHTVGGLLLPFLSPSCLYFVLNHSDLAAQWQAYLHFLPRYSWKLSSSIRSAVLLFGVNRQLRAIWLEHSSHIIPSILRQEITAYRDAVSLAMLEYTWSDNTELASLSDSSHRHEGPHHLCLPQLVLNADLASSAARAWKAWMTRPEARPPLDSTFTSVQASYYSIRKLLLARSIHRVESSPLLELYETLCNSSKDTIFELDETACFLTGEYGDYNEQIRHGMLKSEKERTGTDKFMMEVAGRSPVGKEACEIIRHVLAAAVMDRSSQWKA